MLSHSNGIVTLLQTKIKRGGGGQSVKFEIEVGCRPPGGNVGNSRQGGWNGKTSVFGMECGHVIFMAHATARRSVA